MSKYQFSKLVMEKCLRRSFYDAVLELYETVQGTRVISVSLEGNLSLIVNKDESFIIKLNEIAQRADDREDPQQGLQPGHDVKVKAAAVGKYIVKKEEFLPNTSSLCSEVTASSHSVKHNHDKFMEPSVETSKAYFSEQKYKFADTVEDKLHDGKGESDFSEKSTDGESESDDDDDSDVGSGFQVPATSAADLGFQVPATASGVGFQVPATASGVGFQVPATASGVGLQVPATSTGVGLQVAATAGSSHLIPSPNKVESEHASTDINFLPVGKVHDFKRKYDYNQEQSELHGRKSSKKKSTRTCHAEGTDDASRTEESERSAGLLGIQVDDGRPCSPQLLPHTATGPVITEDDSSSYSAGLTESQIAQLAVLQMRDSGVNVNMFRQQDLEDLARQQQQWKMVAYQRSLLENPYMQQYQREPGRLRWEYTGQQQQRDLTAQNTESTQHTDEVETIYRDIHSQNAVSEATVLAAAALEQAKMARGDNEELDAGKLSSQHMRFLAEEQHSMNQLNVEYQEELRPESHLCILCGAKFSAGEHLLRHMEKHRVDFERSCSVCQSGTLTGNMLLLHMEASHGPETNLPLLSSSTQTATTGTNALSFTTCANDVLQTFPASLHFDYSGQVLEESTAMKHHPPSDQIVHKVEEADDMATDDHVKDDLYKHFHYSLSASTSKVEDDVDDLQQNHFLGVPSQCCSLIGCQVCGEKFALSEALDEHMVSQHKDTGCTYSCKPCSLSFNTHLEYSKHLAQHETSSSTSLKCTHCLKSFKSVKQLRLHHVTAHACCHFCEYCRAGFPDATSLQLHEQLHTLDPDKLTFRCDICSKAFYTQSQCSAHKRTHKDEKAHACEVCGSAFFKRGDLTKHVRTVHSPSRVFACRFCGKRGTRMDNMRSHVRSHHKSMPRDQIITMIDVIE